MTEDQVIDLLTAAAMFDRRTVGRADAKAWLAVVGDLPFEDALTAVRAHYTESADWLMPAHIRQRVREIRDQRLRETEVPPPPRELLGNPVAYQAALYAATIAIADGDDPQQAMTAVTRRVRRELEAS